MSTPNVVLCAAVRTAIGTYGGALKDVSAASLGATAIRASIERAGWKLGDIERAEVKGAFAAVVLAIVRELGLPEDIVNVEGGAIAHGHPIGATGAVLTTRLLHAMRRDGLRRGLVTPLHRRRAGRGPRP